jgi:hypothetical protein
MATNATVDNAVKQKIISDYIKTPQGRSKLAASMTQPLRLRRDYTSVGRKTFLVEQLPDGALPIYDKDPDVTAFVVGEEGENILAITKPRRVIFPLFEIASSSAHRTWLALRFRRRRTSASSLSLTLWRTSALTLLQDRPTLIFLSSLLLTALCLLTLSL